MQPEIRPPSSTCQCRTCVLQQRSGSFTSTAGKGIDCRTCVSLRTSWPCTSPQEEAISH